MKRVLQPYIILPNITKQLQDNYSAIKLGVVMEYIITFENTHFAILSERVLLEKGLKVTVFPLPSQLKAGCGICLRIKPDTIAAALGVLKDLKIGEISVYSRNNHGERLFKAIPDWEDLIKTN